MPDAKTAIAIAVAVWGPIYGEEKIADEKPYHARLYHVRQVARPEVHLVDHEAHLVHLDLQVLLDLPVQSGSLRLWHWAMPLAEHVRAKIEAGQAATALLTRADQIERSPLRNAAEVLTWLAPHSRPPAPRGGTV